MSWLGNGPRPRNYGDRSLTVLVIYRIYERNGYEKVIPPAEYFLLKLVFKIICIMLASNSR